MQTFLPYSNFGLSAQSLDRKRLGKQRVEAFQIIKAIEFPNRWSNHPAVRMWIPYKDALGFYMNSIITEWVKRGYENNLPFYESKNAKMPIWIGNEDFHRSHRLMLAHKGIKRFLETGNRDSYDWYNGLGFVEEYFECQDIFTGYVWPVDLKTNNKVRPFSRSELLLQL